MGITPEDEPGCESLQRELRAVFAQEAAGSLARVESLLERPVGPDSDELVEALLREFHTMKVGAAAAGYARAARTLHDAESLLDAVRGSRTGFPHPDELLALRRVVERVRDEFADSVPVGGEDAVTLRGLWPLLARGVATAAATDDKLVVLDLEGSAVVFEGALGSVLRGVLLHLVRNAVVHGIEAPAERRAAAKPRVGRVVVAARRDRARLRIAVSDDGRGLDRAAIAAAADRAGLRGDAEELVLRPGFSTRESADELAGRGVGLDAVTCAVRELGGEVRIESRDGAGCTVHVEIPATGPRPDCANDRRRRQ